jgi:hypothetical protein
VRCQQLPDLQKRGFCEPLLANLWSRTCLYSLFSHKDQATVVRVYLKLMRDVCDMKLDDDALFPLPKMHNGNPKTVKRVTTQVDLMQWVSAI